MNPNKNPGKGQLFLSPPAITRAFFYTYVFLCLASSAHAQYTKLLDLGSTANGANPYSPPISDGTFLYGMTTNGGINNSGTIYKMKLDGTGFVKLLDFDGSNGSNPYGSLYFDGTFLYGMTNRGGLNGFGIIFKIKPDGTGFSDLLDFNDATTGVYPYGSFISDGTFLYGTTVLGGPGGSGTVFKIKPDGSGFVSILNFDNTNNGSGPYGSLYSDGTFLYGMTQYGIANSYGGTIFKIKPDGTGYANLLNFSGAANGGSPNGTLISDGVFLYGMTPYGGSNNNGVIFKIKPDGSGFVKLVDFDYSATKGAYPRGSLVSDGTFLYGMTTQGLSNFGTVFKVKSDGTGFVKLLDADVGINGPSPEGTLFMVGSSLYGTWSGFTPNFYGLGYLGTVFKINTDGSGYAKLLNYEATSNTPYGSLYSDGTFQYGMTYSGGLYNYGTIFKVKPDGTNFTTLFDFDGSSNGRRPYGSLISDGTFLYGMTSQGGTNDQGVAFKIKPDGSGFVKLLDFDVTTNGGYPQGSFFYDGVYLYGFTAHGGPSNYGNIFKIKTDGTGFTNLLNFDYTNNGAYPYGSLISDGTFLYGMTNQGNPNGWGTVFKIKPDGTGFTNLLNFDNANNGGNPKGDLFYDGSFLYGTTSGGGANSSGTVFKIKTDGTSYAKLLDFDGINNGGYPNGSLISDGTFLYGMTSGGSVLGQGTIFKIKTDGTNYNKLLDFNDGSNPQGSLISDGSFLYGMTQYGGATGSGIIFKSTMIPFVSITEFTPSDGPVDTFVTIYGTGFDPTPSNNVVMFNGTPAVVKTSSATTLTVAVPIGATSGSVTISSTIGTSSFYFDVTANAPMFNGTVQSCNYQFTAPTDSYIQANHYNNVVETFVPTNANDKIQVSFSSFSAPDDILNVYDGPTTASPLIISLNGNSLPANITATGSGGELTFEFSWGDGSSSSWLANISCQSTGSTISVTTQPSDFTTCSGNIATFTTGANGTTNVTYQWQYSPDGIIAFTDLSNTSSYSNVTTSTLSVNTTGNFGSGRYRCKINGDLASTVFTNDEGLFINPLPSPPSVQGASGCAGTFTLSASGGTSGQYVWYTVATGGTAIAGQNNSAYATPPLSATTTYYVSINNGTCEGARTSVTATVKPCPPPVITAAPLATQVGGKITLDLVPLITTANNNLDLTSLAIVTPSATAAKVTLPSGAAASIDLSGVLTIDYSGISFSGTENIAIKACDTNGNCATQQFGIDVAGDIIVYNGISPNGKNPSLVIEYINILPGTKRNTVTVFDRWENQVWHGTDYDNTSVVFTGVGDGGSDLPSGVYFYKIDFAGGRKPLTGFISLRR